MAKEGEPQHPLHPQRIDNERADDHRRGHAIKRHAADHAEMSRTQVERSTPGRQNVLPNHERKGRRNQGDATGHKQSTRIHALGLRSENVRHRTGKKLNEKMRERLLITERWHVSPVGSRSKFHRRLGINRVRAVRF